jgi:hypothetical protein
MKELGISNPFTSPIIQGFGAVAGYKRGSVMNANPSFKVSDML